MRIIEAKKVFDVEIELKDMELLKRVLFEWVQDNRGVDVETEVRSLISLIEFGISHYQ